MADTKLERLKKMGKIVKYCSSCDEGFAEKFGFCPDCGAPLQAFEMNPLMNEGKADEALPEPPTPAPIMIDEVSPLQLADETPVYDDGFVDDTTPLHAVDADVIEEESNYNDPVEEAPAIAAAADTAEIFTDDVPSYDEKPLQSFEQPAYSRDDDGGYSITVIQDNPGKQRNLLLLGSTFLVMTVALSATIISLFQKDLGIGAIGDERSLAYLIDEVPTVVEEEVKPKEEKKSGGGGGGGREEEEETTQGDLANQQKNPVRPPDAKVFRSDNFELKTPPASTEGDKKFVQKYDRYGNPDALIANFSNGRGSGGGQGSGTGTGQGSGSGTGAGSGSGSGSGGGNGNGNGDGDGSGSSSGNPPPPRPVGVTSPYKILAKPQAKYNDAGRTNGVQGSVRLKITLLANGSVGSITPVTRLPHGLTEQAIAAARQLRFEPKKVNGVPVATIVTIDYSFSIY